MSNEIENPETEQVETPENPESGSSSKEDSENKIAELQKEKDNLVGELKEDRKRRQELQDQINELQEALKQAADKNNADPEEEKIKNVVKEILTEDQVSKAKTNKQVAFEKFIAENKEYHPDNDTSGLRLQALKDKFEKRFNLNGIVEVDDFKSVIKEAHTLLRGHDTPSETSEGDETPSETPASVNNPGTVVNEELSQNEAKLIERNGWTKDKYLKIKAKQPRFIEELIAQIR